MEAILKGVHFPYSENFSHEQKLRRALLNSDYFHENFIIRFQKKMKHNGKFLFSIVASSFASGMVLAVVFQVFSSGITLKTEILSSVNIPNQRNEAQVVLQDLYKKGRLQFTEQKNDGTRVYRLSTKSSEVQVYDNSPYIINLVSNR